MSNIDQSILEYYGGYNSFIGRKSDIEALTYDGRLCFKLGDKKYFKFSKKFLLGLFKIIKIKFDFLIFDRMSKDIISELINEALLYTKEVMLFTVIKIDTLTSIYENPIINPKISKYPDFIESTTQNFNELKLLKIFEYKNGSLLLLDVGELEGTKYRKVYGYFVSDTYNGIVKDRNHIFMMELIAENHEDNIFILPNTNKSKSYLATNGFDNYAKLLTKSILIKNRKISAVFKNIRDSLFYEFGFIKNIKWYIIEKQW